MSVSASSTGARAGGEAPKNKDGEGCGEAQLCAAEKQIVKAAAAFMAKYMIFDVKDKKIIAPDEVSGLWLAFPRLSAQCPHSILWSNPLQSLNNWNSRTLRVHMWCKRESACAATFVSS